jgi:hypothetical protein
MRTLTVRFHHRRLAAMSPSTIRAVSVASCLALASALGIPVAWAQATITLKLATIVSVEHPFSTSAMKFTS